MSYYALFGHLLVAYYCTYHLFVRGLHSRVVRRGSQMVKLYRSRSHWLLRPNYIHCFIALYNSFSDKAGIFTELFGLRTP